ncbi:MAG: signal peptidase I [Spirochaetaceae bacterium]|nr:signal peptidase I [Spirochaetaceae bacterium]MBR3812776.1 signal peptidase I [Spirochaetaceae bacterium]MDD6487284.1 signal peptidase I [Spirochaetales bacterium]
MNLKFRFVLVGIGIGVFLKLFIFDILKVEGTSMEPALKPGSHLIENKLAYGIINPLGSTFLLQWAEPKNGDIVLYYYNNHIVVKRCIALQNEPLEIIGDSEYILKVNQKSIPLTEQQYLNLKDIKKVPEGRILAVGDNYIESVDSRDYGFVSTANVLGKALWK